MALFFGGRVFAWYLHVEHHRAGSVVMHSCSLQSAPLLACTYSFLSVSANKECIYKLFLMATVQHLHMLAYCVIFIILKYLGSFTLHTWPIKTYLPRSPHYCDSLALVYNDFHSAFKTDLPNWNQHQHLGYIFKTGNFPGDNCCIT